MSRKIKLTRGYYAVVDDVDFELVNRFTWWAHVYSRGYTYARHTCNLGKLSGRQVNGTISMHRLLMRPLIGMEVDHIDHDGLNNRRANLRLCTRSQNAMNRVSRRNSLSKYKGVTRFTPKGKWIAYITVHGQQINLGGFKDEREAAIEYNKAAIQYHKEYAHLNDVTINY